MTPTIRAELSIVWAAMMALVLAWPARGHAALVLSASVQAKTMVRVITYDRNFNKRFQKGVTIGVLFDAADQASTMLSKSMISELTSLNGTAFQGLPLKTVRLEYSDADGLAGAVRGSRVNVIFVCVGLDAAIEGLTQVTRTQDIISIGATHDFVSKGLSFGIVDIGGKPGVVVNRAASRKEGTKFSAQLLRIAKVVD